MKRLALIVLASCSSTYQSARTLPPGKTQVTASMTNVRVAGDGDDDSAWAGDVMVRTGLAPKIDGGFRLGATPSPDETVSQAFLDVKAQLTDPAATATLSLALPVGAAWGQQGFDFEDGLLVIAPTALLGIDLGPATELVLAPKLIWVLPEGSADEQELGLGASIGVRLGDASRTWAIHPEISITKFADGEETMFAVGLGVAAGN